MKSVTAEPVMAIAPVQAPASMGWLLASLSLPVLLSSLGTSIANVGLPTLALAFGASFQQAQWIVLAYLLAITTLVVSVGRLADLVGPRRLLLAGIAIFGAGSALCGALSMALVSVVVPKARTGSAMGLLGTMSAVGTALGPALGGLLIDWLGWHAIFLVKLPFALAALLLVQRCLPPDGLGAATVRPRFDHLGTVLLAFTLAAYALAVTIGRGHFGPINVMLLGAALGGMVLFVLAQRRAAAPLIQPALLLDPVLCAAFSASALVVTVMMATLVVGPFYLARTLELDAGGVGLVMSAGPVVAALAGVPAGRLADRFGSHAMIVAGLFVMAAGCIALALLPASLGVAGYLGPMAVITVGYAGFQAANNSAAMANVAADQRGVVSGLLNLARNLGLVTGASVMGAVFAALGLGSTFGVGALLIGVALLIVLAGRSMIRKP